jgi:hypothetical protein
MAFPKWHEHWEKPDLLRGKRGWTCPDYVNIGVALVLAAVAFGLFSPANLKVRATDSRTRWENTRRERALTEHLLEHMK